MSDAINFAGTRFRYDIDAEAVWNIWVDQYAIEGRADASLRLRLIRL